MNRVDSRSLLWNCLKLCISEFPVFVQCYSFKILQNISVHRRMVQVLTWNVSPDVIFLQFLLDYSGSSSEGEQLVEFLSHRTSGVTLFVPHNSGFTQNKVMYSHNPFLFKRDTNYLFTWLQVNWFEWFGVYNGTSNGSKVLYLCINLMITHTCYPFIITIHLSMQVKLISKSNERASYKT